MRGYLRSDPSDAPNEGPGSDGAATVAVTGLTVRHRRTVALDAVDLDFGTGVHGLLASRDGGHRTGPDDGRQT